MVLHIVLFRPRPDVTVAERQELADAFAIARRDIPEVRRFHVGRRLRTGAAYEASTPDELSHAALVEFDDAVGLRTYLEHPSHVALGTLFGRLADRTLICDVEVSDDEAEVRRLADVEP